MFLSKYRNAAEDGTKSAAARSAQLDVAFDSDSVFLLWLAEVITGDAKAAQECLVDARKISEQQSGLFVDWLTQWARSATVQQAIQRAHSQISLASRKYDQIRCPHGGHAPIPFEQFQELQLFSAQQIVSTLDPFVRAVGVLRGVSHCALQDCSIRLGTTRTSVAAACCVFDQWVALRKQTLIHKGPVHAYEQLAW